MKFTGAPSGGAGSSAMVLDDGSYSITMFAEALPQALVSQLHRAASNRTFPLGPGVAHTSSA